MAFITSNLIVIVEWQLHVLHVAYSVLQSQSTFRALEMNAGHALRRGITIAERAAGYRAMELILDKFKPLLSDMVVKRYRTCRVGRSKMMIESASAGSRKCNHVFLARFGEELEEHVGSSLLFFKISEWEGLASDLLGEPLVVARWYPEPIERVELRSIMAGEIKTLTVKPSRDADDTRVGVMMVQEIAGLVGLGQRTDGDYMVLGRRLVSTDLMSAD